MISCTSLFQYRSLITKLSLLFFLCFPINVNAQISCSNLLKSQRPALVITDKALKHILEGDFGVNANTKQTQIKGGLHTFSALEAFLANREDISELHDKFIESNIAQEASQEWSFTIEDPKSGVGYVRLPESAYGSKSLKGLMATDLESQGGYLWKTLFPRNMGESQLKQDISVLYESSAERQDRGWAEAIEGIIVREDGTEYTLKIAVKKETGELISAYPSFFQENGIFIPTDSRKNMLILNQVPRIVLGQNLTTFRTQVEILLGLKIHHESDLSKKDFTPWNQLELVSKESVMRALTINQEGLSGGLSLLELILRQSFSGYTPNALNIKARQIIDAVIADPAITKERKLKFLTDFISNHTIYATNTMTSIFMARFLIVKILALGNHFDTDVKKYIIRTIESSPIYWTILLPLNKGTVEIKKPILSITRVMSIFFTTVGIHDSNDDVSESHIQEFVELVKTGESVGNDYFQLIDAIDQSDSGYATSSFQRTKMLAEYLNVHTQASAHSKYLNSFAAEGNGQSFTSATIRKPYTLEANINKLRPLRNLAIKVLFQTKDEWRNWIEAQKITLNEAASSQTIIENTSSVNWALSTPNVSYILHIRDESVEPGTVLNTFMYPYIKPKIQKNEADAPFERVYNFVEVQSETD